MKRAFWLGIAAVVLVGHGVVWAQDADEIRGLIAKLGSNQYSQRETASKRLEELGASALDLLTEAALKSDDPEIQIRAMRTRNRIEEKIASKPTLVMLNYRERSLKEVVESLGQACDAFFVLNNPGDPRWKKPVTLVAKESVTFWEALDRLCEVGDLNMHLVFNGFPGKRGTQFQWNLGDARVNPSHQSVFRHGPYLVLLYNLEYNRNIALASGLNALAKPSQFSRFTLSMMVAAEPKLNLAQGGQPQIKVAVDDLNNNLLPANFAGNSGAMPMMSSHVSNRSQLNANLFLIRPEQPGKTIKLIQGVVPVTVAVFRGAPLIVPLKGAASKTFKSEENSIIVHSVSPQPGDVNSLKVDITLKMSDDIQGAVDTTSLFTNPYGLLRSQLEVVDAKDRELLWHYQSFTPKGNNEIQLGLNIMPNQTANMVQRAPGEPNPPAPGSPDRIRYRPARLLLVEIPFEFRDIPMP